VILFVCRLISGFEHYFAGAVPSRECGGNLGFSALPIGNIEKPLAKRWDFSPCFGDGA
jgi:hypothetical protein